MISWFFGPFAHAPAVEVTWILHLRRQQHFMQALPYGGDTAVQSGPLTLFLKEGPGDGHAKLKAQLTVRNVSDDKPAEFILVGADVLVQDFPSEETIDPADRRLFVLATNTGAIQAIADFRPEKAQLRSAAISSVAVDSGPEAEGLSYIDVAALEPRPLLHKMRVPPAYADWNLRDMVTYLRVQDSTLVPI